MNLYSQLCKKLNSKSNPLLSYTLLKCFKLSDSDGNLMLVLSIIHKFQNISLKPKHLAEREIMTCYNVKSPFRSADFENDSISGTSRSKVCVQRHQIFDQLLPALILQFATVFVCVKEYRDGHTHWTRLSPLVTRVVSLGRLPLRSSSKTTP
jgi:hypothetical protein